MAKELKAEIGPYKIKKKGRKSRKEELRAHKYFNVSNFRPKKCNPENLLWKILHKNKNKRK